MAVTYGGETYYYATNIQGDVVAILDSSNLAVVFYTYDAWGNILTTTGTQASTLGRFICADSLVSTGQGVLGNNMFAYCLNNPVNYSDTTGCLPTNDIYPVCIDRGCKPVIATSDHKEDSDELLDHIIRNYLPITNSTVYITVERLGTYSHVNDNSANIAFASMGIVSFVTPLLIPGVREYALLSKTLQIFGIASTLYGITAFLPPNELQNRDYSQYSVTITWSETTNVYGYPNVFVTTDYSIDMLFVRDDDDRSNIFWYLQSSNTQEVRSVNRIN